MNDSAQQNTNREARVLACFPLLLKGMGFIGAAFGAWFPIDQVLRLSAILLDPSWIMQNNTAVGMPWLGLVLWLGTHSEPNRSWVAGASRH